MEKNPDESTKMLLELSELAEPSSIYKNQLHCYKLAMTNQNNEIKEIPFITTSKIIYSGTHLTKKTCTLNILKHS